MNRLLLLIIVAGLTFLIVLFAMKPELIESVWLWLIGLSGAIIKGFQLLMNYFKEKFGDDEGEPGSSDTEVPQQLKDNKDTGNFKGITLKLLRYHDDGETTLGLLYINSKFYCYTLEDTFNEVKIKGKTRIPAGVYDIELREELTPSTIRYRERFPLWFVWHLWVKDVPNFTFIHIHSGGDHDDTEGCILVSDSLNIRDSETFLTNSRETFRRLYRFVYEKLKSNVQVRIEIFNENKVTNIIS